MLSIEKVVISSYASSGLYGFRSAELYLSYVRHSVPRARAEFCISDVYRAMLRDGHELLPMFAKDARDTVVLGTPAEYESYRELRFGISTDL